MKSERRWNEFTLGLVYLDNYNGKMLSAAIGAMLKSKSFIKSYDDDDHHW